jgi:hypothetical protein
MDQEPENHNQIRERAYQLWQEAGCPDGRDEEFWHKAAEIVNAQSQMKEPELRTPGPDFPKP